MRLECWAGYKEHATSARLENYRENIGRGNCTIFAAMIQKREGRNLQGLPWCTTFVFAVIARPDILGRAVPGSRTLARRMKRRGFWRGPEYAPRRGDVMFMASGRRIDHVGIVLEADRKTVTSIDGNSHDCDGIFAPNEGGAVAINQRDANSPKIRGYAAIGLLWADDGQRRA